MMLLDARQPHVQPLEFEAQPAVVDAQAMEDGGVQVVDVHGIGDDVVAEVVGLAVNHPRLDACAGHPEGEALRMMITAVIVAGELALAVDRPAKLTAPDHQCVVQKSALLEVGYQCEVLPGQRPRTGVAGRRGHVAVLVPAAVKDLHKTHIAFG